MSTFLKLALIMTVGLAIFAGCREEEGAMIEVPPGEERVTRQPQEMSDEFMAKVKADRQLKEYEIKAIVREDRRMTLTGKVPNTQLKKKAERLAETVMGVQGITNEIAITGEKVPEKKVSDRALRRELEKKIKADSQLKEFPITVEVKDGEATIEGFVSTSAQRKKVGELADTVAGLTEVKDDLRLSKELTDEFIAKIEADSQLKDYPITVMARRGNVLRLAGTVPNRQYRRKAATIAWTISGVRKVENELETTGVELPPEKMLTDKELRKEIERKMAADSELKEYDISVEVDQGKATLKGAVETRKERRKVAKLAETVHGVKKIDNQVERKEKKEVAGTDRIWPRASARYVNNLL